VSPHGNSELGQTLSRLLPVGFAVSAAVPFHAAFRPPAGDRVRTRGQELLAANGAGVLGGVLRVRGHATRQLSALSDGETPPRTISLANL
jgi:hypothetical protein